MNILKEIQQRMSNLKLESKTAIWYTASNVAQKGVSLLLVPIYIRIMSTQEYGIYTYYHTLIPFLMIICTFNATGPAIYKGLNTFAGFEEKFISNVLGFITFLSAVVFLIFFLGYSLVGKLFGELMGINMYLGCMCVLEVWATYATSVWRCKKRYEYKYKPVVAVNLILSVGTLLFGLLVIMFVQDKLYGVITARLVLMFFLAFYCSFDILKSSRSFFDFNIWKYILQQCVPLLTNLIALRVIQKADQRVVLEYEGASFVAIYGLGLSIMSLMYVFTDAFDNTLSPMVTHSLASKKFKDINTQSFAFISILCFAAMMLCAFSPEIIRIIGTNEYYSAAYCVMPLVLGVVLEFVTNLLIYSMVFYEKKSEITFLSVFVALMNIILNMIFVPKFGFIAASYTTLTSYIGYYTIALIFYYRIKRDEKINLFALKKIMFLVMGLFFICSIEVLLYNYFVLRILLTGMLAGLIIIYVVKKYRFNINIRG